MSHFWQGLTRQQTPDRFMPCLRQVAKPQQSNPDLRFELCDQAQVAEATAFLTQFFAKSSKSHPILYPTLSPSPNEIILIARDQTDLLVGTVRYKFSGYLEGQPIHCIDCFCVHPMYRGTGLASRLLLEIHEYTNRLGKRYSIFLKEGKSVPSVIPFYSSTYIYKAVPQSLSDSVTVIPSTLAVRLVSVYQQLYPDTFWIHSVSNPNQCWYLYKTETEFLLVCIQDSFQTFQGQRIGWLTACFRSGSVSINTIIGSVRGYGWIWMDKAFGRDEEGWSTDGAFHWYGYQWTSCLRPNGSYGIVV
jgi:GNAT superfamily N-acetyltransferase